MPDKRYRPQWPTAATRRRKVPPTEVLNSGGEEHYLPLLAAPGVTYQGLGTPDPNLAYGTGSNPAPASPVASPPPPQPAPTPAIPRPPGTFPAPSPTPTPAPSPAPTPTPDPSAAPVATTPADTTPVDTTPTPSPAAPSTPPPAAAAPSGPASSASPQPPVANAGANQTTTAATAILDGSGSSDPQGSFLTYAWSLVSGPNSPVISNPTTPKPQVTGLIPGSYIFQLTVFNSFGLESQSTVSVTVQGTTTTVNAGTATLNTGTVIATAPTDMAGQGPYGGGFGGGGGGGGGSSDGGDTTPTGTPLPWDNVKTYLRHNWWWLALLAAGALYVGSLDEKSGG